MRLTGAILVLAFLVLLTPGASTLRASEDPPERPMDGIPTFTDVAAAANLTGGGNFFAWGDYDRDGDEDLLVDGGRLFRNEGPPAWAFTDVTTAAGITGGGNGNWADFNNDGYLDFYQVGPNRLWRNDGDGTFTDVTLAAGNPTTSDPTGVVAWGDYDRDGYLDLFLAGAENWNGGFPIYYRDHLFRNDRDGTFTEVTAAALGTVESSSPKYGRGATWADFDDDGWPDLYVTNYRQQRNYLYRNNHDGTFTDVAAATGSLPGFGDAPVEATNNPDPCDRAGHGVGSSWADYDNDGDLDLLVGTFDHKDWRTSDDTQLWRNNGDGTFTNVRATAGIPVKPYDLRAPPNPRCGSSDGSIWTGPQGDELIVGATWGDVDDDGFLDLWMPQIYDISYAYSYLYRNNGDGTFTDIAVAAGVRVYDTYGGALADYDRDGDLDLVTGGRDSGGVGAVSRIHLFRNNGIAGHAWIELRLAACGPLENSAVVGARVTATAGGATYLRNVEAGQSSHSQENSLVQHIGLGHYAGAAVDVGLRLPSGASLGPASLAVNEIHALRVGCVDPPRSPVATLTGTGFRDVTLTWSPPTDETWLTNYAVYTSIPYRRDGAGYFLLGSVPKGTTTYVHAGGGVPDGTTHYYRIVSNGVGTSAACATQVAKYAVTLLPGMNLFSLPVRPFNTSFPAVFATVSGQWDVVRAYDASDAQDPWRSNRAGRLQEIPTVDAGTALWVHVQMFSRVSFAVAGYVPDSVTLPLRAGWNLVGYASGVPRTVGDALAAIPWAGVEAFDSALSPYYLKRLTAASALAPGDGLWIRMAAGADWTVAN